MAGPDDEFNRIFGNNEPFLAAVKKKLAAKQTTASEAQLSRQEPPVTTHIEQEEKMVLGLGKLKKLGKIGSCTRACGSDVGSGNRWDVTRSARGVRGRTGGEVG